MIFYCPMIPDKKAEGGFFEAIVAFMIVTTVITALFANLLYWQGTADDFNDDYLTQVMGLTVKFHEGSMIVEGLEELLEQIVSQNSVQAVGIEIVLVSEDGRINMKMLNGEPLDSNPYTLRDYAIHDFGSERRLPLYYILTLWYHA